MYELTVLAHFAAAHQILGHPEECQRLHGHTWNVEVTVAGDPQPETGMVIDFKLLKSVVYQVIDPLDHSYLNDLPPFAGPDPMHSPTAENIARHIYNAISSGVKPINPDLKVRSVRVWESPTAAVTFLGEA